MNRLTIFRVFCVLTIFVGVVLSARGATYYSQASGDPETLGNWNTVRLGGGSSPANFTSGDIFVIQNTHTMTTASAWTMSGTGSQLQIESGGTFIFSNSVTTPQVKIFAGGEMVRTSNTMTVGDGNAGGFDLTVDGIYRTTGGSASGITYSGAATGVFQSGSKYIHDRDGGTVPTATWDINSTCEITGYSGSSPAGINQTFGNFVWDCPGQGGNNANLGATGFSIAGNFDVKSTGTTGSVRLNMTPLAIGGNLVQTGGTFRIANATTSRTVTVAGNFSLSGGTLLLNDGNGSSVGTLNVAGNFTQSGGTIDETNINTGRGSLVFNGSAIQTYTPGTVSNTIDFTINNASGVTLAGSATMNNVLTFTAGNLTLGANNLTLGSTATVTGAAATKCIVTNGMGIVSRAIAASGSFQFSIASTATSYNPLTIALAAGDPTETFSVRVQSSVNPSTPDNTLCVQRTWNIDETTPNGNNATLTFGWITGENGSSFSAIAGQGVFRHNGSAYSQVTTLGNPGSSPYSATTVSAVTQFSPFVVGQAGGLPVQLASFTGVFVGSSVRLNWRTISEVNNYGFFVQRRMNGLLDWWIVENSFVPGHGTTNEPHDYSFIHANVAAGSWQYRLKQVDLDGTEHFTEPINVSSPTSVKVEGLFGEVAPIEFALKQNYPNPFNPETNIKFSVEQTGRATLEIFNLLGQKVATLFDDVIEAGYYQTVRLNGSSLASGTYFYRLQSGEKSDLKKLLLLK